MSLAAEQVCPRKPVRTAHRAPESAGVAVLWALRASCAQKNAENRLFL